MATIESIWYAGYDAEGNRPHCRRLCRLPMREQYGVGIDLAMALIRGEAGWRNFTISLTGERYWYWPALAARGGKTGRRATGWWLLPRRTEKLADLAERYTETRAIEDAQTLKIRHSKNGSADFSELKMIHLRRLQRAAQRAKRRPIDQFEYVSRVRKKELRKRETALETEIDELWSIKGAVPIRLARCAALRSEFLEWFGEMRLRYLTHDHEIEPFYGPILQSVIWISRRHRAKPPNRFIAVSSSPP